MFICTLLTHFYPIFPFYTPLKTPENQRFSGVFRGYKMRALVRNGVIAVLPKCYRTSRNLLISKRRLVQFLVRLGMIGKICLQLQTKTFVPFLASILLMTGGVRERSRTALEGLKVLACVFFLLRFGKKKPKFFILPELSYLRIT